MAQLILFNSVFDSYISSQNTTSEYCSNQYLYSGDDSSTVSSAKNIFIKFPINIGDNIEQIPVGSINTNVELSLWEEGALSSEASINSWNLYLHKILKPFEDVTYLSSPTWSFAQFSPRVNWTIAGGL